MKHTELERCRRFFKLSGAHMADLLCVEPRTYWRWERGQTRIPGVVPLYLSCLLRYAPLREEAIARVKG